MYITRIELENIKSHVSSSYEFSRGTTAITGENGAGKTTIIEAIAWTLFDLLDYKKEDFVRRGAKRGVARVTFESSLDGRHYVVYRDTGSGYNVYDPALKMRVADKKDEVCRFLWQHLGVDPGTDLDSLFRRAIGVPQGTFTAIFLDPPAERKKAFDKLLKVEEYRRGAEELLRTSRLIDQHSSAVRERIARFEGQIARIDEIEEEHSTLTRRIGDLAATLKDIEAEVAAKRTVVEELDRSELALQEARVALDRFQAEQTKLAIAMSEKESQVTRSRDAATKVAEVKADYERHTAAILKLDELERERGQREKLRENLSQVETAMASVQAERRYTNESLDRALKAHSEINELRIAATEQERLENDISRMRDSAAHAKAIVGQIAALDEKIERLRESYRTNKTQVSEALDRTQDASGRETLEKRDGEIMRELASLHAALERDERFQREIENGLCPILSEKCLNLKEGQTLEAFVTNKFEDLRTRIAILQTEHGQVAVALRTSRDSEKFLGQLATLQAREKEIADEGRLLRDEKTALQSQLDALPKIENELAAAESALKELNNPKGRMELLSAEARREGDLRQKLSHIESNVERLESDRRIVVEQLEMYKDLDAKWAESVAIRDTTADANRAFIANESLAALLGEYEQQLDVAKREFEEVGKSLIDARAAFDRADEGYDRQRHRTEREALVDLEKRRSELTATLESARHRETALAAELSRLIEVRKLIRDEFTEKEKLEKLSELTAFIRDTLKEAAPLVARNYVYHVSAEANQMFREITGNAEHSLKWAEDYGIMLEEGGYERPFQSLSGGEQMAGALAVRLALLRQLTDLRIAFFDEPTSNLDLERRENLAQQISQIKHFEQLFVISHDDTFEGFVDNVVTVEKGEPGQEEAASAGLF